MGVGYGPSIVTNGLSLVLDAANPRSYPGTGSSWYDISGNGKNASGVSVSYSTSNAGYMVLNGSNYFTVPPINFGSNNFTIELWTQPASLSSVEEILETASSNTANNSYNVVSGYPNSNEISYYLSSGGASWDIASGVAIGTGLSSGKWYHLVLSRVANSFIPYVNGALSGTVTTSSSALYNYTSNLAIGTFLVNGQPSGSYSGNLSVVRLYTGVGLSQQQVQQNFNAYRGRYGI